MSIMNPPPILPIVPPIVPIVSVRQRCLLGVDEQFTTMEATVREVQQKLHLLGMNDPWSTCDDASTALACAHRAVKDELAHYDCGENLL